MSTRRNRIGRRQAERILDAPTGADEVSGLLRDAATPADAPGEAEALAAFRAARASAPSGVLAPTRVHRKLAVPIAGALGLALAGGGVAFAASQGAHIPLVTRHHAQPTHPAHPTHPVGPTRAASPTEGPTPTAAGTPDPSLRGTCNAWLAHKSSHGQWSSSPAFSALITAAGGTDEVATYCGLVVTHPTHPPKPTQATSPTHPAHPVHPSHPAKPTQSADPTRPPKPTQAADPTHPAHPVHPPHPVEPTPSSKPGHPKKAH